jgi:polysaccharide biosynthesis protein PslL
MKKAREAWLDAAKGIAILCVVIGHSDINSDIINTIFWFHMPAFFIIAGYLFKPKENYLQDRAYRLLIPYLFFLVLLFGLNIVLGNPPSLGALIIGGRALNDDYPLFAPFWFVTCLLVTQVVFANLLRFRDRTQLFIIFIFFILAHVESYLLPSIDSYLFAHTQLHFIIPWDADVALIALSYYSIGFFARQRSNILHNENMIKVSLIIFIMALVLNNFKIFNYLLDMKFVVYNNPLLDLIIPLSMTLLLFGVSHQLTGIALLSIIGDNTMIIMYLHLPIMVLASFYTQNVILQIFLATALPLIVAFMLKRSTILSILLLGNR